MRVTNTLTPDTVGSDGIGPSIQSPKDVILSRHLPQNFYKNVR